jgi:peroxiredoxin Q/BCP
MESHIARRLSLRNAPCPDNGSLMTIPILAALLGASASLKVGDKAPDFTLPGTDGKPVILSKLLERGPVILAFFPKAFTPG